MFAALIVGGLVAPFLAYPTFLMKVLCFALFASAFNLLLGFGRPVVVRPRRVLCLRRLRVWIPVQELGAPPRGGYPGRDRVGQHARYRVRAAAIRRSGIYFAMITLALPSLCISWRCSCRSREVRTDCREFPGAACSA